MIGTETCLFEACDRKSKQTVLLDEDKGFGRQIHTKVLLVGDGIDPHRGSGSVEEGLVVRKSVELFIVWIPAHLGGGWDLARLNGIPSQVCGGVV